MAKEVVLVRYGEIALKGKNRVNFENKLIDNIEKSTGCNVRRTSGRLVADAMGKDTRVVLKKLKKVFGITSISIAKEIELDMNTINKEALNKAKGSSSKNFRVTVQRTQKKLKPSPELQKEIGAYIVEKTGKKVKLKEAGLEIFVEIADKAYVFTEKIAGFGGLPVGISGNAALLIDENNKASALAGLLAMKRGCNIYPFSYSKNDARLLEEFGSKKPQTVKNMADIEEKAEKNDCLALVIGQTLHDFKYIATNLTVFRPLIAFSNKEIDEIYAKFEDEG